MSARSSIGAVDAILIDDKERFLLGQILEVMTTVKN
jgi:hypothetical protein